MKRKEKRLRLSIRKMSKNNVFNWMVLVLVFLNSVGMSLQKYRQDQWLANFLGKKDSFPTNFCRTFATHYVNEY